MSYTPKQISKALKVSESSVKRWCDKGVIPTHYSVGGHRKIPLNGLVNFLRSSKHELVDPIILGLPKLIEANDNEIATAVPRFCNALLQGDEVRCRQIILELYLSKHSIAELSDELIAKTFQEVGALWECQEAEIYQERLGCEIAIRLLHELRKMLSYHTEDAPLALGGTVEGDHFQLGTTIVELVFRALEWNAISLGVNLPFLTLDAAIEERRPILFWLSCSYIKDEKWFLDSYNALYEKHHNRTRFVVGGQGLSDSVIRQMRCTAYCENMQQLESFIKSLDLGLVN